MHKTHQADSTHQDPLPRPFADLIKVCEALGMAQAKVEEWPMAKTVAQKAKERVEKARKQVAETATQGTQELVELAGEELEEAEVNLKEKLSELATVEEKFSAESERVRESCATFLATNSHGLTKGDVDRCVKAFVTSARTETEALMKASAPRPIISATTRPSVTLEVLRTPASEKSLVVPVIEGHDPNAAKTDTDRIVKERIAFRDHGLPI